MKTISERIKEGMELRGLKQTDLVDRTGISKGALSSYISGRYVPKQNNIYLISKALNVNEAWLMGNDVPMERNDNSIDSEFPMKIRSAARDMMDLSEADQELAINMIRSLANKGKKANED